MRTLAVFSDKVALARGATDYVLNLARAAIEQRGEFSIALAGGSTPKDVYALLAAESANAEFARWKVFFGDERCVPPDHPDSNFKMASEAWLSRVNVPSANVFRMAGEKNDLAAVAAEYEAMIRSSVASEKSGTPRFDLVLLGIGDDGHTASIFPDVVERCRGPELVVAVAPEGKPQKRLTLTYAALNAARAIAFLVSGAAKRPVLSRILKEGPASGFPSAQVNPRDGGVTFLVDTASL